MFNGTTFISFLGRFPYRVSAYTFLWVYYEAFQVFSNSWGGLRNGSTASDPILGHKSTIIQNPANSDNSDFSD